jgi:hypothetical protein
MGCGENGFYSREQEAFRIGYSVFPAKSEEVGHGGAGKTN